MTIEGFGAAEVLHTALEPLKGEVQRPLGILEIRVAWGALVESHHDVGAYDALSVHHILGGEEVLRAIDMRAEGYALGGQLAVLAEREDLKAATVGEDGFCPTIEGVESSSGTEHVATWTEVKMIGVAQDNLGFGIVRHIAGMKIGVSISPWSVVILPARALELGSVYCSSNCIALFVSIGG